MLRLAFISTDMSYFLKVMVGLEQYYGWSLYTKYRYDRNLPFNVKRNFLFVCTPIHTLDFWGCSIVKIVDAISNRFVRKSRIILPTMCLFWANHTYHHKCDAYDVKFVNNWKLVVCMFFSLDVYVFMLCYISLPKTHTTIYTVSYVWWSRYLIGVISIILLYSFILYILGWFVI